MADKRTPESTDRIDAQMQRLAGSLRDQGVAPARDLWGDIDQAITAAEQRQIRPPASLNWVRFAASAAAVAVFVVAGWWGLPERSTVDTPPVAELVSTPVNTGGLDVIDSALHELNLALAKDPDNRSLANLSLMLHQSRGKRLRQNMDLRLNGG